jgi:Transcriptional regulatory protein, C terminal
MPDESRVLRVGEWRVDPDLDEFSREGQTIRVEPRTMRLLMRLAAHAGRVVDVQQLLEEVWPNVVVSQGSVYQAIAQLRQILGDDSEHPSYIENLPPARLSPDCPCCALGRTVRGTRSHSDDNPLGWCEAAIGIQGAGFRGNDSPRGGGRRNVARVH